MDTGMKLGLAAALATGMGLAVVSTLEGRLGKSVGALNASLLEHLLAGILAVILFLGLFFSRKILWSEVRAFAPLAGVLAMLVFTCVAGIAYSIPKTGIAVGNFALVFGQLGFAVIIEATGLVGAERTPISLARIGGLILMALGLVLVLPRD